jgi:Leucine-rich repeat (LRR) protein
MPSDLRTPTLTTLDLSSNVFTSLAHITCLSSLPKLTTLSLRSNPLRELQSPAKFPALRKLDVAFTDIPNLASLDPIPTVFPSLTKLLTKSTPLMNHESASLHTIARLPGITELNYEDITPEKRLNAELFYLGFVAKQLAEGPDRWNEKTILDDHPRYKALCELHGEPAIVKKKAEEDEAGYVCFGWLFSQWNQYLSHKTCFWSIDSSRKPYSIAKIY